MPIYARGDYVKVEFQDETTVIREWMWVRLHHCDDEKQLVFGTLDNEPLNDYAGKVKLGSERSATPRFGNIEKSVRVSQEPSHPLWDN